MLGVSNKTGDSWRFQPKMKEAPSNEGLFLLQRQPHNGKREGWGTGDGGVGLQGEYSC